MLERDFAYTRALCDAGRWDSAGYLLETAVRLHQGDAQAWYRLGNVRTEAGHDESAHACFESASALDPGHGPSLNNLGSACERLGRPVHALHAYRLAVEADPGLFEPYLNLARLCEGRNDIDGAVHYLRAGLERHPDHPMLGHLLAAAERRSPAKAPREHVQAYFDDFAPHFEEHLVRKLHYRVPQALAELIGPLPEGTRVLDAGCGTGLMGAALQGASFDLVGIDLSSGMLEHAHARGIYSGLVLGDVCEALAGMPAERFDLAVAADVLIYIGDLDEVFGALRRALRPHGRFAFSLELEDALDYRLNSTGRYAHSRAYVRRLAAAWGFAVTATRPVSLRLDGAGAARGLLGVLERLDDDQHYDRQQ
jgi:predicted TPR repeat methyltransferase